MLYLVVKEFMKAEVVLGNREHTGPAAYVAPLFAFHFSLLDELLCEILNYWEIVEENFFFICSFRFNIYNQIR